MVVDVPDLCRPFLASLPISGVGVSVITPLGSQSTLCSSDSVSARIEELQFELGEGPQWIAAQTGEIVSISDTAAGPHDRWPVFAALLSELAVGALFAVPMKMGAATIGAATLYRTHPGELNTDQWSSALAISSAIAGTAVQRAMVSATDDAPPESFSTPALRREVHQATGMILAQLNTTATVAYARLQAYAFAHGRSVQAVAHDVTTGSLTFTDTAP